MSSCFLYTYLENHTWLEFTQKCAGGKIFKDSVTQSSQNLHNVVTILLFGVTLRLALFGVSPRSLTGMGTTLLSPQRRPHFGGLCAGSILQMCFAWFIRCLNNFYPMI
jgi:hypothetical protein